MGGKRAEKPLNTGKKRAGKPLNTGKRRAEEPHGPQPASWSAYTPVSTSCLAGTAGMTGRWTSAPLNIPEIRKASQENKP